MMFFKGYGHRVARLVVTVLGASLLTVFGVGAASADTLPTLPITVFQAPSQSLWIPLLIQRLGLDRKHGFVLAITQKPSNVAYTDFATGKDPFCYCVALPAAARFKQQGADITLLWNIFGFEADIVVKGTQIKSINDLRGKTLMTDTITGNWAQAKWFLQHRGLDLGTVSIRSTSGSGAASLAELQLGRVDALLVNSIEGAAGVAQGQGELHILPVFDEAVWKRASGTDFVPQIAVGVSTRWIAQPANLDLARRFYAANRDAAGFIRAHPADAARQVATDARIDETSLEQLLARYPDWIHVEPLHNNLSTIALLTQTLLPQSGLLPRPLSNAELQSLVANFTP